MTLKILFTVRRIYFDQIVPGTKTAEVRRASEYWKAITGQIEKALNNADHVIAVFVCGKESHWRTIRGVERFETAYEALGREPSEQGKKDIGEGAVIRFNLADDVTPAEVFDAKPAGNK